MKQHRRGKVLHRLKCPGCSAEKTDVSSECDDFGVAHVKYTCDVCGHEWLAYTLRLACVPED